MVLIGPGSNNGGVAICEMVLNVFAQYYEIDGDTVFAGSMDYRPSETKQSSKAGKDGIFIHIQSASYQ